MESTNNQNIYEKQLRADLQNAEDNLRRKFMANGILFLAILIFITTLVRHFISPIHPVVVTVLIVGAICLFAIYFLLNKNYSLKICLILFTTVFSVLAIFSSIYNGGLWAPVLGILNILPIVGFITYGYFGARLGVIGVAITVIVVATAESLNLTAAIQDPGKYSLYRVVLLMAGSVFSYSIGTLLEKSRKQTEERLLKVSVELAHMSKVSSLVEMASGIAHEINNPLAIISGSTMRLRRHTEAQPIPFETFNRSVEHIEMNVTRIAKIIKDLRNFCRDFEKPSFDVVSVDHLLNEATNLCREKFKNHNISLIIDEKITELKVECHLAQMIQVILSLLSNAHDAVEHLNEKWVRLSVKNDGANIVLRITDSGHGIDPEIENKIMQPFFTTKQIGKGMGLGLSVAKGIIEEHHGILQYDNTSPNTSFFILLPIRQNQIQTASQFSNV